MSQISLREALDRAHAIEGRQVAFYSEASKASNLPGSRDLFARLAEEEQGHQAKLDEFRGSLGPDADSKQLEFDTEFEKTIQAPWPTVTPHNVHVFAIQNEVGAIRFYEQLALSASDEPAKKLFDEMAQAERKHRDDVHEWFDGIDRATPKRDT